MARIRDNLDLATRRKRLGWRQGDIAQQLGAPQSAVSNFENGKQEHRRVPITRPEYEAALDALEAQRTTAA